MNSPLDIVKAYAKHRSLTWAGKPEQALAFMIAELGELTEAHMYTVLEASDGEIEPLYESVFSAQLGISELSDFVVSTDPSQEWVRNNDRVNTPDISDEIGDVLMMLIVYANFYKMDVLECMLKKMAKKGFIVEPQK